MKLHQALRKVIRHFGVNVIEEKRLMSFLADYKAFDDYPAVKDVMRAIATGDSGKKICLAADGSDEEFLRLASEIRETLVREKCFKEEFARYAVDSVSFALGIVSSVSEPSDHGYEAVRKDTGSQGSTPKQESRTQGSQAAPQAPAPRQVSPKTAFTVSGDTWQTASDGAESHRRFYRGKDLTSAFDSGEFSRNVADGSFRDIFPGDYIVKKITVPAVANLKTSTYEVKFIIADLDIAMNQGSPRVTAHHAVIVPEKPVFYIDMSPTDTNAGGYAGSYMHKTVMPAFAIGLTGAFGENHLLNGNFDGSDRTSNLLSCTCRLMTLSMVFGQTPPTTYMWDLSESDVRKDNCLGGAQLAAFSLHPDLIGYKSDFWVSGVYSRSSLHFAYVDSIHVCIDARAAYASHRNAGVRPFALLV
ncbi:MAG: hypothetical protein SPL41_05110 [Succinivibrionaceae bacterium]|nr:hypothetical protein [Succinivibrionaceae bacterium]MDY6375471.1 hypothetical protein [Succinivibrionaceae bacterium]